MMTRGGHRWRRSRCGESPRCRSRSGSWTSIRTTSGASCRGERAGLARRPSPRRPPRARDRCPGSCAARPRVGTSSSTMRTRTGEVTTACSLVVAPAPRTRQRPPRPSRPRPQPRRRVRASPPDPRPSDCGPLPGAALSVVLDRHHQRVGLDEDRHDRVGVRRVLRDVGERLLHDPVRRPADRCGDPVVGRIEVELDVHASSAHRVDELTDAREPVAVGARRRAGLRGGARCRARVKRLSPSPPSSRGARARARRRCRARAALRRPEGASRRDRGPRCHGSPERCAAAPRRPRAARDAPTSMRSSSARARAAPPCADQRSRSRA